MKAPILLAVSQCKRSPSSLISPELVEGAFALIGFLNRQEMLDTFIERTNGHWELISASKDVTPILENVLGGFQELGKERIDEILRLVKNDEVDEVVQKQLLDLGKSLVRIAIRHLHASGGKSSSIIDVSRMAKLYQIDLNKK